MEDIIKRLDKIDKSLSLIADVFEANNFIKIINLWNSIELSNKVEFVSPKGIFMNWSTVSVNLWLKGEVDLIVKRR